MAAAGLLPSRAARRGLRTAACCALALVTAAPAHAVTGSGATALPVGSYATTVGADEADVYYPDRGGDLPVALLLQGANVDKAQYAGYARAVAAFGFVVVVPNHRRSLFGVPGLWASSDQVPTTVSWAEAEDARDGSPVESRIDEGTLTLLGHSFGGAAGLAAVQGICTPPFCSGLPPGAVTPPQLKAGAFFGTNYAVQGGPVPPIANTGVPVGLVQGTADGIAAPAAAQETYDRLQQSPKLLVSVTGANHFGVTDTRNPPGALPDPSPQTVGRTTSIRAAARWSALFLRARLGDRLADAYVHGFGDAADPTVTVQQRRR